MGTHKGWTFDPSREIWFAKTGKNTWTEIPGALDDAPSFSVAQYIAKYL